MAIEIYLPEDETPRSTLKLGFEYLFSFVFAIHSEFFDLFDLEIKEEIQLKHFFYHGF